VSTPGSISGRSKLALLTEWLQSFEAKLLLGALLLRLLYLSTIVSNPYFDHPITDEKLYDTWARAIVSGEPFIDYPYYDSPLHAYYLAALYWLFGDSLLAVRVVQVIIGVLNVAVLYRIARRLFDSTTAQVAGVLAAVYAPFLYYEGLLLKESFALFLMNVSVLLLLGALGKPSVLAFWNVGVVVGTLALSRVNALIIVPAALIVSWLCGGQARSRSLAIFLGLIMIVAPVTLRNWLVSGEWIPITVSGGQVLYTGNNPANKTGDLAPVPFVRSNPAFERMDFHHAAEASTGRRMTPGEVSAYWRNQSLRFMAQNPVTFTKMVGHRLLAFWNHLEMPDNHSIDIFKRFSWVLRLPLPGYWLIAPLALVGLLMMAPQWRDPRGLSVLYVTVLFYFMSLLPFWISSRYRLPIVGVLILFASAALVEVFRNVATKRTAWRTAWRSDWLPWTLGIVVACTLCWVPLAQPNLPDLERNLAYAYEQTGQYDEAIAIYERLRASESNPLNQIFLANALGRAGKVDEAAALLKQLTAPGQPSHIRQRAYNTWGDLARRGKQWLAAERAYRQALALDQSDYGAWNNLGISLVGQKRHEEALAAFEEAAQQAPQDMVSRRNVEQLRRYLSGQAAPKTS
jgi:4-amino-4-deoxy-L-arabinose transferase-like glycosyltransferase